MRQFVVQFHEMPTNRTKPYRRTFHSMEEVVEATSCRSHHWIKEIVDGEERVHRGHIWKDSGALVDSCYGNEKTQTYHISSELRSAIEARNTKKAVLA